MGNEQNSSTNQHLRYFHVSIQPIVSSWFSCWRHFINSL